jgi:cytochrome P450
MIPPISDDIFAPEVVADPHPYHRWLRENDPIHWNETYQAWIITRYDDIVWIFRHPELFSNSWFRRDRRPPYPPIDEADAPLWESVKNHQGDMFIQHDPPEHLVMRRVLQRHYSPKSIAAWRPFVEEAVGHLLDAVADKGQMDIRSDLAMPLPVMIISEMVGIPESDRARVYTLARKLSNVGSGAPGRIRLFLEGIEGMIDYLSPLLEERMREPQDDILSLLLQAERDGVFTRHQVLVNATQQFFAGHETTLNMICNGTLALLNHPEQFEFLRDDPAGLAVAVTEECLRYDPPIVIVHRIASETSELRGHLIREGDRVRLMVAAANRDPSVFEDPETFDVGRHPNPHIAFGSGEHHCQGAGLARLEGQVVFKELAERFPTLRVATTEHRYEPSIIFRALTALPVTWD